MKIKFLANRYFFIFYLISTNLSLFAQPDSVIVDKKFSVRQLKGDLLIFEENIKAIHPALDLYYPQDSLEDAFSRIERGLDRSLTAIEFYRRLRPLLQYIANGHTDIIPAQNHLDQLANTLPRFPFDLYVHGDTCYVHRNVSENLTVEPGFIVKKINGKSPLELIDFFTSLMTRDGFNTSLPRYSAMRAFKSYYALLIGTPATYEMEFQNRNGQIIEEKIAGVTLPQIRTYRNERYPGLPGSFWQTDAPVYTLDIEGDMAVMTLRTFDKKTIRKRGERHKKFFKKSFAKIRQQNIDHLIIDLRGNGGGDPEPTAVLFSHLYDQRFDFYSELNLAVNKVPNPKLYDEKIGLINLIFWLKAKKKKNGGYQAKMLKKYQRIKPSKNIFKGDLYVLTNPASFSATGEMTGIIKNYNLATFVGEEPGGNPISNTSGYMLPLILPQTKTKVILPVVQFVMAVDMENTGHGVVPDYPVKNSFWDELNGRDAVMDFTKELIRNKQ